ncbi:MAG: pantetheine-phosphate adenylyltransferase [Clostridia bacterium]|nr:pantetheine-phosphate adenylyltransferase [Clostridia bacterium]
MKKIAIVPGSYDPATLGHIDIIKRAAEIFDTVYAAIMVNSEKKGLFSPEERLEILSSACRDLTNVKPIVWTSLSSKLMSETGAKFIVKGARNATDFDYEHSLSEIMRHFSPDCDTVIFPSRPEYFHVSSTYARELLKYGHDLSDIADKETAEVMKRIYIKR